MTISNQPAAPTSTKHKRQTGPTTGSTFERSWAMSDSNVTELEGSLSPYLCHCLVSRQMARHVSRIYDRHLAPTGINAGELAILEFVANAGTIGVSDLATLMFLERTTLLRNLKPLIEAGYLETARDPAQKKRHTVSLTETGERKRTEAHPLWLAAQDEFEREAGQQRAKDVRGQALQTMGVI